MLVTARLRPPDRLVEVADVRRVKDLLSRLEVLPTTVLVIRDGALLTSEDELHDGDAVEVRFAISGGAGATRGDQDPTRPGLGARRPAPRAARPGTGSARLGTGARSGSGEGGA